MSPSSPIHHASLIDAARHSPALLELIDLKLTPPVINYVVDCVADTVNFAMGRPSTSSQHHLKHASFTTFITDVIHRAEVTTPVILAALVYIDRAKPHLHIALEQWALERVFLGALITASKYLNDSTLKNVHWSICTGVFGKRDIGRIEREFLDVLDFQLGIAEDDILSHHDAISAVALPTHSHRYLSPPQQPRLHRTHRRRDAVPALSPSSQPSSASSFSSPRTPPTVPHSTPASKPPPPSSKKPLHMSTLDLLRSFPIPISLPSSQMPLDRYSSAVPPNPSAIHAPPPAPSQMQLCA